MKYMQLKAAQKLSVWWWAKHSQEFSILWNYL